MKYFRILAPLAAALLIAGCGGGSSPSRSVTTGKAIFKIIWPAASKLIPTAANSIEVAIVDGTTPIASQTVARPAQGGTATATFNTLPVGTLTANAAAYPTAQATGTAQAFGSAPFTVTAGQTATVTLTMATTVTKLSVAAQSPSITAGSSTSLNITATDGAGSVVLLAPADLSYATSSSAIATVANGTVTGVGAGTATITVSEAGTNISGTTTVTVSGSQLGPQLVSFSSDRNGVQITLPTGQLSKTLDVYTMHTDGTSVVQLTHNDQGGSSQDGSFSPDGTHIAFSSDRDDPNHVYTHIYTMLTNGTGVTRLTDLQAIDVNPRVSPDGTKILFASDRNDPSPTNPAATHYEIYVMNADGTNVTRLTNTPTTVTNFDPEWSPDGTHVLFSSDASDTTGNTYDIWVMGSDSSSPTQLTHLGTGSTANPILSRRPVWSPDGTHIAFQSLRNGATDILYMTSTGQNVVDLSNNTVGVSDGEPAFTPDSTRIFFRSTRSGSSNIWVMNTDGTNKANLTNDSSTDRYPHLRLKP